MSFYQIQHRCPKQTSRLEKPQGRDFHSPSTGPCAPIYTVVPNPKPLAINPMVHPFLIKGLWKLWEPGGGGSKVHLVFAWSEEDDMAEGEKSGFGVRQRYVGLNTDNGKENGNYYIVIRISGFPKLGVPCSGSRGYLLGIPIIGSLISFSLYWGLFGKLQYRSCAKESL